MDKQQRKILKAKRLLKQKRYLRLGDCNYCGDCCRNWNDDGTPCEYFQEITPDFGVCAVYGKPERYTACPLFPEDPQNFRTFKRCGYYFQDRHDDGRLIYPEEWPGPQGNVIDDSDSGTA
jgi:hypothetical protein